MGIRQVAANDMKTELEDSPTPETASVDNGPKVVQYTGGATIREITSDQWADAGAKMHDTRWTVENRHLVPAEEFTNVALAILARDADFRLIAADKVS